MDTQPIFDLDALLEDFVVALDTRTMDWWGDLVAGLPLHATTSMVVLNHADDHVIARLGLPCPPGVAEPTEFWQAWDIVATTPDAPGVYVDPRPDGGVRFAVCVTLNGTAYARLVGLGQLYPVGKMPADDCHAYPSYEVAVSHLAQLARQLERVTLRAVESHTQIDQTEARLRHKESEVQVLSERYAEISRDNIDQHERLRDTNKLLEERVRERTAEMRAAYAELEKQLTIVGDLQRSLLPSEFPPHPGYEWAPFYQPSDSASGDYFDVIPICEHRVGIVIADVCGHGAPSAVMMAMARVLVRSRAEEFDDPAQMLHYINEVLCAEVGNFIFITMIYAILDTRDNVLTYAAAGHPAPFLLHGGSQTVDLLPLVADVPVNLSPGRNYETHSYRLRPRDSVVFFTDGVTEIFNPDGEMYTEERMHKLLTSCTQDSAIEIVTRIFDDASRFAGHAPLKDDFTLLVLTFRDSDE